MSPTANFPISGPDSPESSRDPTRRPDPTSSTCHLFLFALDGLGCRCVSSVEGVWGVLRLNLTPCSFVCLFVCLSLAASFQHIYPSVSVAQTYMYGTH